MFRRDQISGQRASFFHSITVFVALLRCLFIQIHYFFRVSPSLSLSATFFSYEIIVYTK